jgi:uncharacterized protein (TIGR03067 family)
MRSFLLRTVGVVLIAAVPPIAYGAGGDLDDLKGTWLHVRKSEPDKFEVTGNGEYKVRFTNLQREQGSITVDPRASPKTIDLTIRSGRDMGKVRKGLYTLKKTGGGKTELHMYLSKPGGERPKEIKERSEGQDVLWVVQR